MRLHFAVAAASTLLLSGLAATSADGATVAERAGMTLSVPSVVAPGATVKLRGTAGRARRGTKVTIFQRPLGRAEWVKEGTTRVRRKHTFRYTETVTNFDRQYKACVRRACSPARTVKVQKPQPQTASLNMISVAPTTIEAGQPVTVTGQASANLVGRDVYLQTFDNGSKAWGSIGSAVVQGDRSYAVSGPITTAGKSVPLRVVAEATAGTTAAFVDVPPVVVYGWYYLSERSSLSGTGDFYPGSMKVNAVTYPKSVYDSRRYSDNPSAEWDLSRACTTFAATVGMADFSSTTGRFNAAVKADAVQKWSRTDIALGQSHPVLVDITGALRLRLEFNGVADRDDTLVFGDARILCAF